MESERLSKLKQRKIKLENKCKATIRSLRKYLNSEENVEDFNNIEKIIAYLDPLFECKVGFSTVEYEISEIEKNKERS